MNAIFVGKKILNEFLLVFGLVKDAIDHIQEVPGLCKPKQQLLQEEQSGD